MCKKNVHIAFCQIIPPNILANIVENGSESQRKMAFQNLNVSAQLRGQREVFTTIAALAATSTGTKRRSVYDAKSKAILPGKLVRTEGGPKSSDKAVNEAFDGAGKTYDFFSKVYKRNSIDDRGMEIVSSVHYRRNYNNAVWNGQQMCYGDGDGVIFNGFTKSIDIIGHELMHGITQFEANLVYQDQPGALNEHFSDVFGSLVKQHVKKQTASKADWLIGEGLFTSQINGVALRSMKAPGTAYDDPLIGKDPQPDNMNNYDNTQEDNGGVHINSGIPNKAFYLLATSLGGYAWEKAGRIWYITLRDKLRFNSDFQEGADMTYQVAEQLYGKGSKEHKAVKDAWNGVGISV
jgi:Zn-dependent metalloprotease